MKEEIRIHFRISKEIKNRWKEKADSEFLTLTDFIISRVEENLTFKQVREVEEIGNKLINKQSIIGNNINQIARQINIDKNVSESQLRVFHKQMDLYLEEMKEEIRHIKKMNKLLYNKQIEKLEKWSQ